ncbi:MAG TPA: tetraacyldisaccharide 4'-kinase [Candidatus Krumholzibacteria bacterium]|nr:tetraacyldisaccharide 4'-kinase [Candidatus Krumholzibacteria bacterium]
MRTISSNRSTWEGVPALTPLSWVYRGGVAAARALRRPAGAGDSTPRVVAIGNLEVGGSGKTPLALWLLERWARAGKRAAYVSRGFGSAAGTGPLVTVVPAANAAPASFAGLRLVFRDGPDLAASIGDEAAMVARRATAIPLVIARDKRRAVEVASAMGAEVVVVDDAFQSFALARHLDLLLLDARRPLASGRVLPAGRLREPPSAIARADVVVFNGAADAAAIEGATARVARWIHARQRVYGLRRVVRLVAATPSAKEPVSRAVVVSGIARPDDLRDAIEALGVHVADAIAFRDHHRYTEADVGVIRERARGGAIVTTEKDWVKLERFEWGETPVWVARLDVELVGGGEFDA